MRKLSGKCATWLTGRSEALALLAVLPIVMVGLLRTESVSAAAASSHSAQGVTPTTIKVGITYPDVAAVKNLVNVDPGNYQEAYQALINQINAHGGINGRKIVPVFAAVNPLGTAPAATACTELTEDDRVFAVMGFFQTPDPACYVQTHDTALVGASLAGAQASQAEAPWFNSELSDSDLIPKEMSVFKEEGAFVGKKVAVVGEAADQTDVNLVLPALHKLGVAVVASAINDVPTTESDTAASSSEYTDIAQKFESSGANVVVAVGSASEGWPAALQGMQSTYLPRLVATNETDLSALATNTGYSAAVLKGALTAANLPPASVWWNDPEMKRCMATIRAAEPGATIADPVTGTTSTPHTWRAPLTACQEVALFEDIVKAAGRTLNNDTFDRGGESLTHVTIPGGGGTYDFGPSHHDGDGPVFVYEWSASSHNLVLKTTVG
jgi:ABC-type branched-subunit amino acid transport system substrate-binding protein